MSNCNVKSCAVVAPVYDTYACILSPWENV